ncbi:hypothetical protein DXN04_23015 [Chitinophaga silvisoli]|uniref:Uncharacterized protein n=1 Tax=Chitinophaga silvisoli TaxID=2291814 RepID=A0A3E1NX95_9BACT|nr:hypothetical protein DXN04_23015 [Chitinophaga silvisoli]
MRLAIIAPVIIADRFITHIFPCTVQRDFYRYPDLKIQISIFFLLMIAFNSTKDMPVNLDYQGATF